MKIVSSHVRNHLVYLLTCFCIEIGGASPLSPPIFSFQENKGQISDQNYRPRPDVLFSGTDGKLVYHLKKYGISYKLTHVSSLKNEGNLTMKPGRSVPGEGIEPAELSTYRIDVNWLNCNPRATVLKGKVLDGFDNFYLESCPKGALEVKSYAEVTYKNLYPGIDLKWYEKNGHLKYDYSLAAGADYTQLKLEFNGAESIRIGKNGELIIGTPLGDLTEEAPLVEQGSEILPSHWVINGSVVSFFITGIDPKRSFTIDPLVRLWATFYGGSGWDWVGTPFTDVNGNLYVCGATTSNNLTSIATSGAYQTTFAGGTSWGDSYLVKFNSAGQRLWGTYYGGSGIDFANCCLVDANGDVYISGGTSSNSTVMTTPGCQQSVYAGSSFNPGDAFLAKFDPQGIRLWSTYMGGDGYEFTYAIANDNQNNIYITGNTGTTSSTLIASPGCHQATFAGGSSDGFVVKYDPSGLRLWGTYYGGLGVDMAIACITDSIGNVYIGGITSSTTSISTPGCHQPGYAGGIGTGTYGKGDGFLVKFNSGGVRQWGTYYGGAGDEYIYYCASDALGNIYFSGSSSTTTGTAIATSGSHQNNYGGGSADGMFAKFNSAGQRLWGTYYGGSGNEDFCCCFADRVNGAVYFSGITTSSGGTAIASYCAYQDVYAGTSDAFLTKFSLQGVRNWGTYYGDSGAEDWESLTVDRAGAVYVAGETTSASGSVITSTGAHQTTYGGGAYDGFIVKFDGCVPNPPPPLTTSTTCLGQPAILISPQLCELKWYSDSSLTNLIYSGANYTSNPIFNDTLFYYVDVSCGSASAKAVAHVTVVPGPVISIIASNSVICKGETATLLPTGANNYTWSNSSAPYTISVSPSVATVYTLTGTSFNGGCATKTTISIQVNECLGLEKRSMNEVPALNIFPNPSENNFTVSSNISSEIMISDQLGEVVRRVKLGESNHFKIEIENLPNGIYFIRARSETRVGTGKVIVLR